MPPLLHRQAEAGRHRWAGRALRAAVRPAGQEVDPDRLSEARKAKLRGLFSSVKGVAAPPAAALPGGAALAYDDQAWVLVDDERVAGFGAALAWAWNRSASLDVLVAPVISGVVARRASQFAFPVSVWAVDGRKLEPAVPSPPIASYGLPFPSSSPSPSPELEALLAGHGATPVFEHGVLRGEVLGLEVARVIDGELSVGVGRHDRNARSEMRPGEDPGSGLEEVVAAVRARRVPGAAPHPANTLARSRWLRSVVLASPSLVGAAELAPAEPPLPWFDLPEAGAAPCVGALPDGSDVVVVCSVGVDVDLVPTAADARLLHRPGASLVVVVPEGDDVALTRALAGWLTSPASVVTVPRSWPALAASEPSTST